MRVTRSMTRAMTPVAPIKKEKKQEPKQEKQVSIPKKEYPNIEFITAEEFVSRNIKKPKYINLVDVYVEGDMIQHYPSFEKSESAYIAENRIYAVVEDGYFWDTRKVYGGGCHCYYIEKSRL